MPGNFSYVIPGKLAGCAIPGRWEDLRSDLAGLSRRGIGAIVSLTETPLDPSALRDFNFAYLHLPIPDFEPPAPEQVETFVRFVDEQVAEGVAVVVHCGAGIGRTGTMLACYLVHTGQSADEAVRQLRAMRSSIETPEQLRSIEDYARKRGSARREGK